VRLQAGAEFIQPLPHDHTALAYVFEGEAVFGDQTIAAVHMIHFGPGDHVRVRTENSAARFMLIAGKPFREPIAPYGPFVMNTQDEIRQALAELRNGTFIRDEPATP
jgi:redox-sensitive bicupin YhaK (pirin superfamily)